MSYVEYEWEEQRLELSTLKEGDILRLSFRPLSSGLEIPTIHMLVAKQDEKIVNTIATGGPQNWPLPVECEILPFYAGSREVKASVVRGHTLDVRYCIDGEWTFGVLPEVLDYEILTKEGAIRIDNWPGSK